jgi:diaminopimelate epimerase
MTASELSEAVPRTIGEGLGEHVQFMKYTSFGNTFIIVDESTEPLEDDEHRAAFARWILNGDFGVGGTDNVLYLRAVEEDDPVRPESGPPGEIVFRIFERDGSETLSCGNGLLSSAAFLHRTTGDSAWGVLTEVPSGRPRLVEVGLGDAPGSTWVNVGWPRPVPEELYRRSGPAPESGIDEPPPLTVPLPAHEEWAAGLPPEVTISGSLVFTGEPHLILFEGVGVPPELSERLWVELGEERGAKRIGLPDTPEMAASVRLVHHIGMHVNTAYRDPFPQGVHLNFARIRPDEGVIEYRTWERAIDCETLACGSGAVAMAYIAETKGLLGGPETTFWPHRCRWYQPDASLGVIVTDDGYLLSGRPKLVCHGAAPRFP